MATSGLGLATAVFLELIGVDTSVATNDDVFDFVTWVAAGNQMVDEIASRLRRIIE